MPMNTAMPAVATAMANADWMPFTYAVSTAESWAAVKAPLNSVEPMASTLAGLRVGSIDGRVLMTSFSKMEFPADTMREPPKDWKTRCFTYVISESEIGGWLEQL